MADDGRRMTDAEFRRLSAKIKAVYQEAYEDIYKKNLEFVKRHERKEAQYRQMVDDGKITQADFDAWMRGQVFQGKQWEAKRKQMEATLLHADEMAMDMINGSRLRVFADNANYIGYEIEQHGKIQTSFGLYDINSVKRLLMDEPDLLPPRKVGKDASYKWYNKQIQGAVTQGIIQGEPLTDIAKRIGQTTGERCMNAMLRNARTMHTGAECAGRIEGMHQAQKLGIEVQKKWLATLDNHTRDSHRTLDGQVRDVDKPFDSELGKIRFPGDPNAENPADVWNCRCTLINVYPKYPDSMTQRRDNITGEIIENMTYREWEHWKATGEMPEKTKANDRQEAKAVTQRIEYGELFPDDVERITQETLQKIGEEYPLSRELAFVGDIRVNRGFDLDEDVMDMHFNHKEVTPAGAQYLSRGADGKSGPCIEIHNEYYSTGTLQDEFESRYQLRLKYGDPMQPPKPDEVFFTVSDTFEGVIWHEYGHALSDDKGVFGGNSNNEFRKWQLDYWEKHKAELTAISRYAASHPDEMFAEAFVQAQDVQHQDTLAYKLSKEIMDAFERYTRGEL